MVKNEKRKKLLLLIFLGVFLVVIALVVSKSLHMELPKESNSSNDTQVTAQTGLQVSNDSLELNIGNVEQLTLTKNGKDVTQEAQWYSENSEIADVSNTEPIKGQVTTHSEGETTLRAVYGDEFVTTSVKTNVPKISVYCYPDPLEAKVGEVVHWMLVYPDKGVPNYSYEWTGDGGFVSSDPIPAHTYASPGEMKAHIRTVDTIGSVAEANCNPVTIQ